MTCPRLGNSNSTWRPFDRWAEKGVWRRAFEALQDPDLECLILDATFIRARPCAADTPKTGRRWRPEADQSLGRSQGGFSTKVHGAISGLRLPARLMLTAGKAADMMHAKALIEGFPIEVVIADKAYDSRAVVEAIESRGGGGDPEPEEPSEAAGVRPGAYKDRNLAERFWSKLKQYPAGGHAVREDGPELPCVRSCGLILPG